MDHVAEVVGENGLSSIQHWETEVKTRDRDDKPEYKCKMDISVAFSNKVHLTEYYHNSSWLEHGGAPDKAVRNAFVYQIDSYLKQNNKYNKTESKIKYDDVEDSLVCVISSFSSVSSYENATAGQSDAVIDLEAENMQQSGVTAQTEVKKNSSEGIELYLIHNIGTLFALLASLEACSQNFNISHPLLPKRMCSNLISL